MSAFASAKDSYVKAPLPAHVSASSAAGIPEPEIEEDKAPDPLQQATQLRAIRHSPGPSPNIQGSRRSLHLSDITTVTDRSSIPGSLRLRRQTPRWFDGIVKYWKRHISIVVDIESRRDHLALERTFLAYVRTSLALSMLGITIAQLFRLQHTANPNPHFGFFVLGIPLAATFICAGLLVVLVGAYRFWRQQNAIVSGKVFAGGWEIVAIMLLSIMLSVVLFGLAVGVDIDKEDVN